MEDKIVINITGMTCAACSGRVEKGLSRLQGVCSAQVNLATESALVVYEPNEISAEAILQKVDSIGYKAAIKDTSEPADNDQRESRAKKNELILAALCSIPLVWAMGDHFEWLSFLWVPEILLNPWVQLALATPVQFLVGKSFYTGALHALRNNAPNMDVLVALGTSAAYFYSIYLAVQWSVVPQEGKIMLYFETSALLITFVKLGKWLEWLSKGKTGSSLEKLKQMQARSAIRIEGERAVEVPIDQVMVGDRIQVKPGQCIPMDGDILDGEGYVNEAAFTGESMPVFKRPGDSLIGGTMNQNGAMTLVVTRTSNTSLLSQMVKLVEDAQLSKPPIQRIADSISEYFVQIVVFIAVMTFIIWFVWLSPRDFASALETAISVLVIACPCALGLATPTSIMVGSGRSAEHGILFKHGEYLEALHKCGTIVFDKTGTLTEGKPTLIHYEVVKGTERPDSELLLKYAASVEQYSEHPLGRSIVAAAEERKIILGQVSGFQSVPGSGVQAFVDGQRVLIGSASYLEQSGIPVLRYTSHAEKYELEGKSVVWAAVGLYLIAMLVIADPLKEETAAVVDRLKKMNKRLVMLTGDNERTALAVAKQAGITEVIAGVLPDGKARAVQSLRKKSKTKVAMVGDGVNDAPALAEADFGIALHSGTDIAIEAADIVIMHDSLQRIPDAILISRWTMDNIKQNMSWSLVYNGIGIPIAMSGMLMPWVAGAAMALSSVAVITNALRLRRISFTAK
ncbi:heavy metal translocating P-type ATPase [Paenibacillus tuaregi]|uniref:heavy metal translocating P-type ATPase n=1 Tax=Paenibacillus tuaregi TaxID=1816681 RepID=UPI000838CFEB|nr:heavy metal translocating P-type ATPase [Paenibacillus tuaregi]